MPLTEAQRIDLHKLVDACRDDLKEAVADRLQATFGIHPDGRIEPETALSLPDEETLAFRLRLLTYLAHRRAQHQNPDSAEAKRTSVERLTREAAFTHLNRLCAYKMLTARRVIQDPIGKGLKSRGFLFYGADHPEVEALLHAGRQERAFRLFLQWQAEQLAPEMDALFSPRDPAAGLYPPQRTLDRILDRLNADDLKPIWEDDETIGWVYQFFTTDDERKRLRKASAAPRNSYEMAVLNQFFTPRYIVEFLADNTLGRTWIEMRQGDTALMQQCRYLLRETAEAPARTRKDPREIRVLDPACGSGHFLLYAFELLSTIYSEAYDDPEAGQKLRQDYPDRDQFERAIPALILAHNLWGVDIDRRCAQIAAFALALRAQRAWHEMGLPADSRPKVIKTNIVCAEPMPGETEILAEFSRTLHPTIAELVRRIFEQMKHADTLGSLLRIEDDLREPIEEARRAWKNSRLQRAVQLTLDPEDRLPIAVQEALPLDSIDEESFFDDAERMAVEALEAYTAKAAAQEEHDTIGLTRRLFADDAERGFAFVNLCRQKFDVVLMNPPFGAAALPSKPYIDATYGDTKGDVYKAFVECFNDRLVPGGYLGAITNRTGFFLVKSADWRERIILRLYRPLVLADLGAGVLDAMVETAAYVLRNLTEDERRALTQSLLDQLPKLKADTNGRFTRAAYQKALDLKRHQAEQELAWLEVDGFLTRLPGAIGDNTGQTGADRFRVNPNVLRQAPSPKNVPAMRLTCMRLLASRTNDAMRRALAEALANPDDKRRFVVDPEDLKLVPGQPFAYWVSNNIRHLFTDLRPFEEDGRTARRGPSSGDDFRRLRLWWEIQPANSGRTQGWVPFSKGGAFSPYYADIHLLIAWDDIRRTFKDFYGRPGRMIEKPESVDYFFRAGLTWPARTTRSLSVRPLPEGCIFGHKGPTAFSPSPQTWLPFIQSAPFRSLVDLHVAAADAAARSYEVGIIQKTPVPEISDPEADRLSKLARYCVNIKRSLDKVNETSHMFHRPVLLSYSGETLEECALAWELLIAETEEDIAASQREIDDIAFRLYGIEGEDRRAIENLTPNAARNDASRLRLATPKDLRPEAQGREGSEGATEGDSDETEEDAGILRPKSQGGDARHDASFLAVARRAAPLAEEFIPPGFISPGQDRGTTDGGGTADDEDAEAGEDAEDGAAEVRRDRRTLAEELVSYAVGCAFGRFDIRLGAGLREPDPLPDPFAPLPVCSPGMLTGYDSLPCAPPEGYPLDMGADGILVEDADEKGTARHPDDIVVRVQKALMVLFGDREDAVEAEACRWLDVANLRDYFRRPGAGGFWQDHIKRYSKSRRKAPIYWLLQSSKKSYSLWLYAHKLDADTLFKALIHYIEPALKRERDAQDALRAKILILPESGKERRDAERVLEKQEALVGEMTDFHTRLQEAADLRLVPDLNDGIVLTIAPLYKFTPWKEATDYWKALQSGKYPWANIAQQLAKRT